MLMMLYTPFLTSTAAFFDWGSQAPIEVPSMQVTLSSDFVALLLRVSIANKLSLLFGLIAVMQSGAYEFKSSLILN